jgi:hypothetical protein
MAKQTTRIIPIVTVSVADPVGVRLLAHGWIVNAITDEVGNQGPSRPSRTKESHGSFLAQPCRRP